MGPRRGGQEGHLKKCIMVSGRHSHAGDIIKADLGPKMIMQFIAFGPQGGKSGGGEGKTEHR